MVRVLVIGATGYIGHAVCAALRRSNHRVYGLARSQEKAKVLAKKEVIIINGSVEGGEYAKAVETHGIDVVIDLSGTPSTHKILEELMPIAKSRINSGQYKLGFIYCSGIWVHGSSAEQVNDFDVVGKSYKKVDLVTWRPIVEQAILDSRDLLDVAVIRPGLVYGGTGSIWSSAFGPLAQAVAKKDASVSIPYSDDVMFNLVHVEDTAEAFRLAVEKVSVLSGAHPVFDLITSYENSRALLNAAGKAFGYKGDIKYDGPGDDLLFKALNTTVNTNSQRAIALLGWSPSKYSMTADIDIYVSSWAADL